MMIVLNGEQTNLDGPTVTVRGLLRSKGWSFPLIVVSVNGVSVPRADWDDAVVRDGDIVDAIHLMSGG